MSAPAGREVGDALPSVLTGRWSRNSCHRFLLKFPSRTTFAPPKASRSIRRQSGTRTLLIGICRKTERVFDTAGNTSSKRFLPRDHKPLDFVSCKSAEFVVGATTRKDLPNGLFPLTSWKAMSAGTNCERKLAMRSCRFFRTGYYFFNSNTSTLSANSRMPLNEGCRSFPSLVISV